MNLSTFIPTGDAGSWPRRSETRSADHGGRRHCGGDQESGAEYVEPSELLAIDDEERVWRCCGPGSQVYGVDNLRVVDASIFPLIPATHTSWPVYAVAEKVSIVSTADLEEDFGKLWDD